MTPAEIVVREILSGIQSARVYFSGHTRVAASAEAVLAAAREVDPDKGIMLGLHDDLLVLDGHALHDASRQAVSLIASLRAWGASGLYVEPDADESDLTDLLGSLAFPPVDEPETLLFRRPGAGLMAEGAVMEGAAWRDVPPDIRRLERARLGRRSTGALLERATEDVRDGVGLDHDEVKAAARDMVDVIGETPQAALSLVSMRGHDSYTFAHTLNVTVFSLVAARPYVTSLDKLLRLAQAALLHDIGKVAVPYEVLYKEGTYTAEEWEQMRAHPVRGAEILARTEGVDDLAVMTAFGHHLRADGSGYPKLTVPMRPHPFVGLLSIADVYEALVAERPYKKRMPPERAMGVIVKEAGRQFEARLVRAFVRAIGVFPVGTYVSLSNGRTGIVTEVHRNNPGQPSVRLLDDDGTIHDLSSETSRNRGLRVLGTLDRAPSMDDLVAAGG